MLLALGVLAVVLANQWVVTPPSAAFSPTPSTTASPIELPAGAALPHHEDRQERGGGGEVPEGVTVFNEKVPAVTRLSTDLLEALKEAASDAQADGVVFNVNSGWRSPEYQEQLLRDAIAEYGSEKEAARWVATPRTSAHVAGEAVDIGPASAATWLSRHGDAYGLCQIYRNEPWHFELRPDAEDRGCPQMYADPTEDPRMHD